MNTLLFICHNISSLCLNNKKSEKAIKNAILKKQLNWQSIIELSSGWLVLPALYSNLENLQLLEHLPEDINLYLKTVHELSEERTTKTQADINKISSYFIKENIPAVALKGASYHVNKLYFKTTFRIESDIDLLIPDNYLTLAYSILKKNGFSANIEHEQMWEKLPSGHHLPSLLDKSGTEVELHQSLYFKKIPALLSSAEVWDQAIVHNKLPFSPSPTHMIMLILIHSMINDVSYCANLFNLRVVQDTILIRKKYEDEIDWDFIDKRFKAAHLQYIPSSYFQAIEYFIDDPAPDLFKKNWQSSLYISRIRLNHWIGRKIPRLYRFLFPAKIRICHEKKIIGGFIKEYFIRLKNKAKKILSH